MRLSRSANRIIIAIELHPEYRYKPRRAQIAKLCRKKCDDKSLTGLPTEWTEREVRNARQGRERNRR